MTTQVALLRAVNLAGRNMVAMGALRDLATDAGLEEVRSLLQSGNLVFRSARRTPVQLERLLEAAVQEKLGLATDFFVRSATEWKSIIAGNPFRTEATKDPGHLVLMCCKEAPDRAAVKALEAAIKDREQVRVRGREAYLVYPDGIGRSRLTAALIERKLGTRGTGRNWNTVLKLDAATEA